MNWSSIERRSVEASYLNKFKLISTVNKHHGCVNRLCWTSDGKLLASCSDDLKVNLWNCNTGASIASIRTPHSNNVLDVKFLGYTNSFDNYSNNENNNDSYNTNNIVLLTCSVDSTISVMSLSDSYDVLLSNQYYCHLAAVKSIETDYNSPNVFFSAGDDGIVRQYDDRLNDLGCTNTGIERSKGSMYDSNNCLLATRHGIKINSMRINPTDYNQFVIASTDSTVRTYDRRMLSLHYPKSNIQVESIGSYCPHHLLNESAAYPTYAEFSPCGRNIVASYHGDHSYLFNNSTAVDIASETEMVEDKGRGKADLPWRKKYNNLLTLSEKLKNIKTLIDTGKKTIDLGLNVTSTNVFGRAIELSSYAISEAKSYSQAYENQSANIFGTSLRTDINSSIVSAFHTTASDLNDCVDLYISALQKRVDIFEKRAYLGDNIAGLRDIEEILRYHPYDVDCIVRKIEFLLQANRPELALSSLNEVQDLLLIQSTQADVLTHTQQKIQNLHNLAVEQIQSLRTRNSRDSRNRQLLNQSDAQLGDSSLKRGYFDMMMKNSANTNVSNKKPRLDDRGTGTLAMTSLIMPELQKSKISQIVIPRVIDYCQRYLGAANIAIEMKEIVFLGINGEYTASGSDDGRIFIWDKFSGEILLCRSADPDIVNCVKPHPLLPIIASAGLDDSIRIWGNGSLRHFYSTKGGKRDHFRRNCGRLRLPEYAIVKLSNNEDDSSDNTVTISDSSNRETVEGNRVGSLTMPRSNREWDMLVPLSSVDGSSTSSIVPSEVLRDNAASSNLYSNSSANMSEENGSGSGGIDGYISTASSDFSDDEEDDEADVESDIEYDDGAIEDNEDYNDDSDYNESPISAYGTSHLIRSNHTRSDGNGAINDTENSINLEQETNLQRQKAPITAVPPTAESLKLMNAGKMMNNVNKSTAQNKDNGSKSSGSMDSNAEGATTSESHWTGSYQKNGAYGNGSSENITSSSGHSKDGSSSGQMNGSNSSNSEDPSKSSKDQDSTGSSDSSVDKKGPHEQSKTNVNISQNNSGTISSRSNTASLESSDKSSGSGNTSDKGSSDPNGDPNSEQNSDQNSDHNSDNDGKIGAILGGIPRNVFWGSKVNDDLARRTKTDGVSGIEGITRLSNTAPSIDNESKITLASALEHYPPISDTRKAQTILRDGVTNTNSKKSKTKSLTKKLTRNMYRKALKFAMEGQPMDADEAIALEKIVSFNQKLLRYNPSPLLTQSYY